MKKLLSIVLALAMVTGMFAISSVSSAEETKAAILSFDTTGRNYTSSWGRADGWTGGTSNGNGANIENGLVSSENGNLIISTGDGGANMIQQQLWGDQSKNAQSVYKEAIALMGDSTTGKHLEFTITNNADNILKFGYVVHCPGDIGKFECNSGDTQFEVAPGATKKITLDLPEGKTFPEKSSSTNASLSFVFNAICKDWNNGKINATVSPIYLVENGEDYTTTTVATTTTTTKAPATTTGNKYLHV